MIWIDCRKKKQQRQQQQQKKKKKNTHILGNSFMAISLTSARIWNKWITWWEKKNQIFVKIAFLKTFIPGFQHKMYANQFGFLPI